MERKKGHKSEEGGYIHMQKLKSGFISELLLYSGQYALFYLLMNFSMSGMALFGYYAHVVLIFALLFQTYILYKYGDRFSVRILGSLICPLIYTIVEIEEFTSFILNIGHFFFWSFSLVVGILNAVKIKSEKKTRLVLEFTTVFMNVIIFIVVYMYFDMLLSVQTSNDLMNEYYTTLSILNIFDSFAKFMGDKAHVYMVLGGIILGVSLGLSQVRVLTLKEKINDLFGKYMDESIRDQIIENNGFYEEKQELCVLFSDIRNFTHISEAEDSEKVIKSLNLYFSMWESIATKHDGIINKYIGDAIMIIFGLKTDCNKETSAINCSLEVLDALKSLNTELKSLNLPQFLEIGVGIHTGELILGNVGSDNRKEFTVIGDVVNTASRLESHTKTITEDLIISSDVFSKVSEEIQHKFMFINSILLKGKADAIDIYKIKNSF